MVLDAGRVAEFDTPANLLQNPTSLLSWLVNETGPQTARFLRDLAMGKQLSPEEMQGIILLFFYIYLYFCVQFFI